MPAPSEVLIEMAAVPPPPAEPGSIAAAIGTDPGGTTAAEDVTQLMRHGRGYLATVLTIIVTALLALAGCNAAIPVPGFGSSAAPSAAAPAPTAASGPALVALAALPVKPPAPMAGYSRGAFMPKGWADPDGNGCDARRDALARQIAANTTPKLAGAHHCVLTATVHDPYSNTDLPSTKTDIDHVVSLGNAWETGAGGWDDAERAKFANDPDNLLAVSQSLNRAKGDKDAAQWLPPDTGGFDCAYVARQVKVKTTYKLWTTTLEHAAMAGVLAKCPGQVIP